MEKQSNILSKINTILIAFCAFILTDIYRDFKSMKDEVMDHKYQIKTINQQIIDLKGVLPKNQTYISAKIH
jgi:hypothetical protein